MTSLVLQHLVYRKRKVSVLFSCICSVEEGRWGNSYFAEQMLFWFQKEGRKLLVTNRDNEATIITHLQTVVKRIDTELTENRKCRCDDSFSMVSIAGVLCVADYFLLFYRGNSKGYLLNYRFGRANCKQIIEPGREQLQVLSGRMEENIGLLLCTSDFGIGLSENQIRECMAVEALSEIIKNEKNLWKNHISKKNIVEKETEEIFAGKRHLRELGRISEKNGGRHMGAVLIITA